MNAIPVRAWNGREPAKTLISPRFTRGVFSYFLKDRLRNDIITEQLYKDENNMKKMLALFLLALNQSFADYPILPDPALTPGAVTNLDRSVICVPGYTKKARHVTPAMKREVFRLYGIDIKKIKTSDFEVDHLISLELGGNNSIKNLWPESYKTAINARQKDRLENWLHRKVCKGQMTLRSAQRAIRTNWIMTYNYYFHTNLFLLTNSK